MLLESPSLLSSEPLLHPLTRPPDIPLTSQETDPLMRPPRVSIRDAGSLGADSSRELSRHPDSMLPHPGGVYEEAPGEVLGGGRSVEEMGDIRERDTSVGRVFREKASPDHPPSVPDASADASTAHGWRIRPVQMAHDSVWASRATPLDSEQATTAQDTRTVSAQGGGGTQLPESNDAGQALGSGLENGTPAGTPAPLPSLSLVPPAFWLGGGTAAEFVGGQMGEKASEAEAVVSASVLELRGLTARLTADVLRRAEGEALRPWSGEEAGERAGEGADGAPRDESAYGIRVVKSLGALYEQALARAAELGASGALSGEGPPPRWVAVWANGILRDFHRRFVEAVRGDGGTVYGSGECEREDGSLTVLAMCLGASSQLIGIPPSIQRLSFPSTSLPPVSFAAQISSTWWSGPSESHAPEPTLA